RDENDLLSDEAAERDQPPNESAHGPLFSLRRDRTRAEEQRHESERKRERVGLHLCGERPRAACPRLRPELDRIRRRPQEVTHLTDRPVHLAQESRPLAGRLRHLRVRRLSERLELLACTPKPDNGQPLAADLPGTAAAQKVDIAQGRLDVGLLELEIDRIDEGAHLLGDARSERAFARPQCELRALAEPAELDREVLRNREDRQDATGLQLARSLLLAHADELDLGRLFEQMPQIEVALSDDDRPWQPRPVDESDARTLARITNDETDEKRDHQRA